MRSANDSLNSPDQQSVEISPRALAELRTRARGAVCENNPARFASQFPEEIRDLVVTIVNIRNPEPARMRCIFALKDFGIECFPSRA